MDLGGVFVSLFFLVRKEDFKGLCNDVTSDPNIERTSKQGSVFHDTSLARNALQILGERGSRKRKRKFPFLTPALWGDTPLPQHFIILTMVTTHLDKEHWITATSSSLPLTNPA